METFYSEMIHLVCRKIIFVKKQRQFVARETIQRSISLRRWHCEAKINSAVSDKFLLLPSTKVAESILVISAAFVVIETNLSSHTLSDAGEVLFQILS